MVIFNFTVSIPIEAPGVTLKIRVDLVNRVFSVSEREMTESLPLGPVLSISGLVR